VLLRIRESFLVLILGFKFSSHPKPKQAVKGKMDITCRIGAKCLKVDENLEKCQDPVCDNML
jgi:hypothetical protein